jgi:hypothetical protein
MKNIDKLREIYNSFSDYEKYQLQVKRKLYEKQHSIRFLNLESYVNFLATEVIYKQPAEKQAEHEISGYGG